MGKEFNVKAIYFSRRNRGRSLSLAPFLSMGKRKERRKKQNSLNSCFFVFIINPYHMCCRCQPLMLDSPWMVVSSQISNTSSMRFSSRLVRASNHMKKKKKAPIIARMIPLSSAFLYPPTIAYSYGLNKCFAFKQYNNAVKYILTYKHTLNWIAVKKRSK